MWSNALKMAEKRADKILGCLDGPILLKKAKKQLFFKFFDDKSSQCSSPTPSIASVAEKEALMETYDEVDVDFS